jgi:hypothetical protein
MALLVHNDGASAQLNFLAQNRLTNCYLMLYVNNVAFDKTSPLSTWTEASGSWYSRQRTTTWSAPTALGDGHYQVSTGPYSYTNSTGSDLTIYGYVVTDPTQANPEFGEEFATAVTIPAGETWDLTINYTDKSEN